MTGIAGFVAVFVAMAVAANTAHDWFGVPPMEAGALAVLMWPVVERGWWLFGACAYAFFVFAFGT